jgi:hypothetical protein
MNSVTVKGISGNSILIPTDTFNDYEELFRIIHEKDRPETCVYNYARAVTLNGMNGRIWLHDPLIKEHKKNQSKFYMMLKSWTMAPNFIWDSLSAECPITLETIQDGANCYECRYAFERREFEKVKICPICQKDK